MTTHAIAVGTDKRSIAAEVQEGGEPGLFFLGGFDSSMQGTKAQFVRQLGAELDLRSIFFDYSGHGVSGGDFLDGTISRWLEESRAVFDTCAADSNLLIGSSMGGWLALLLNRMLRAEGDARVKGIILIAPATDMTNDLLLDILTPAEKAELERDGRVTRPSGFDDPHVFTGTLIDDGAQHLLFGGKIVTGCPVHILQGGKDMAVPPAHAQKIMDHLPLDVAKLTLVPNGDHSLSRPGDLALLRRAIETMLEMD